MQPCLQGNIMPAFNLYICAILWIKETKIRWKPVLFEGHGFYKGATKNKKYYGFFYHRFIKLDCHNATELSILFSRKISSVAPP